MVEQTKRGAREGAAAGVIAGMVFAVVEVIAAAGMGMPALAPLRMFASVALGHAAMDTIPIGTAIVVGAITHIALSGIFGAIYGAANARLSSEETQPRLSRQLALGLGYGALLWLVNLQIIARNLYPWLLDAPQLPQLLMHAVFYGLPLGLLYAEAERRARRMGLTATPASSS